MNAAVEHNFARMIQQQILDRADHPALIIPTVFDAHNVSRYEEVSYAELGQRIAEYQAGLQAQGLHTGDRVLLLFPVRIELYALVLALLGLGLVPVFVDMGTGFKKALAAISDANVKLIISVQAFLKYRFILPALCKASLFSVDSSGYRLQPLCALRQPTEAEMVVNACVPSQQGIITFTSGTSGRPKGTDRTHISLISQHLAILSHWPHQPGDIDMPCFPMVTLHNLCCGITTLLPAVDFKQPGAVCPAVVITQIHAFQVTRLSGAPAYLQKMLNYILAQEINLPSITGVLVGGSSVSAVLCARLQQVFAAHAQVRVVYGSTEAEPISHITAQAVVERCGEGYLVGQPVAQTEVAIVNLPAAPERVETASALAEYRVQTHAVGEIVVTGAHVLKAYVGNADATKRLKIPMPDGRVWHRTGDLGYEDADGCLWLVGRVNESLNIAGKTQYPYPIEACIDLFPGVMRSALLPCNGAMVLAVALEPGVDAAQPLAAVRTQLDALGLDSVEVRQHPALPVDRRHNSKIDRLALCQQLSSQGVNGRFIIRLNRVDMLTLSNVAITALASALVFQQQFALALSVLFLALLVDALDGILARKRGITRDFGRYLDGFVDVLVYLVSPALFLYQWGFNGLLYGGVLVCFVACGIIRLSVFNQTGNIAHEKADTLSYLGMPVFWSVFILGAAYLLHFLLTVQVVFPLLAITLLSHAALMLYNGRFYKFQRLRDILFLTLGGVGVFALIGVMQYAQ